MIAFTLFTFIREEMRTNADHDTRGKGFRRRSVREGIPARAEDSRTSSKITNKRSGESFALKALGDVAPIIEAGGVFAYARKAGML